MIFGLFILAVAIIISSVSAYYSIIGLTAIFTDAFWSIVIMGGALELGKITATVWLHKYWDKAGWQFKTYLIPAIVILMLITSMGTFGYLSASHLSQSKISDDISEQVLLFDDKIKTEKDNIAANKKALQQMDAQVDQLLGRTVDDKGANRAVQVRKQQAKERKLLQDDITTSQKIIASLNVERAPIAAKNRVAESHIGPIKYIAALIYGDNPDANLLERAVRWVIILLVFVFDPLAIVLILAADQTLIWAREDKKKLTPAYEEDDGALTDEQIDKIKQEAKVDDVVMTTRLFNNEEEFFAHGKEIARELDKQAYLNKPWVWMKNSEGPEGLVPTQSPSKDSVPTEEVSPDELYDYIDDGRGTDDPKKKVKTFPLSDNDADNIQPAVASSHAGFGTKFPSNPQKGDLFLRVDMLPNKLFKWNGQKWIEVAKSTTDRYAYEEEYIKYATDKVVSGEYAMDDLSKAEQEEVLKRLTYNQKIQL